MRYTYQGGIESSWRARIQAIVHNVPSRYWLPAAAGGIIVLWLGLVLTDIGKPFFVGGSTPKTTSHTTAQAATTAGSQPVSFKSNGPILVSPTTSKPTTGSSGSTSAASGSNLNPVATVTSPVTTGNPVSGVTVPVTDPIDTTPTDPGSGDGSGDTTVTVPPVTTPVVSTPPVTIDSGDGDAPLGL